MSDIDFISAPEGARFFDPLAESWNDNYRRRGFRKRLTCVREILQRIVRPGQRWLDAGCGAGVLTLELCRLGARGVAVDASHEMIQAAARQAGATASRFAFLRVASLESMDIPTGAFDGVLCSSVIEYVDSVEEALAELHRVLRPGGTLILSAANARSIVRRVQKIARTVGLLFGVEPFDYLTVSNHDFTNGALLEHLTQAGFAVSEIRGFDPLLPNAFTCFLPPALHFVVAEKTGEAQSPS